jgi:hypothetical protein
LTSLEGLLPKDYDTRKYIYSSLFPSLEILNASYNNISTLSKNVQAVLAEVKEIDLSYNLFVEFPILEGYLPRLASLKILFNPLSSLPTYIGKMANLNYLHTEWKLFRENPECLIQCSLKSPRLTKLLCLDPSDINDIFELAEKKKLWRINFEEFTDNKVMTLSEKAIHCLLVASIRLGITAAWRYIVGKRPDFLISPGFGEEEINVLKVACEVDRVEFFEWCAVFVPSEFEAACRKYDVGFTLISQK